ncbi:carbohydrate-binding protein [Fibrobacter sp. UWEL]|uniref:carbohydrate-binding protein n=1 Tax=Fibrobacter sp. UWEL TaxID=1896209 RepID=UPI0009132E54|nr:carbohydrate-binding protein [Fibrobacter sp. UWEL]SHK80387.1 O-Glycosyl hydrolase [Fibrobacter sp. UWEL]
MKDYKNGVSRFVLGASLIAGLFGLSNAATVNVDLSEEHQVIRGFGGMVHNQWQGGGGLSEADAKLAFGTGDGQIGLNTLRIPVYASSNDFNKEVAAAKAAKAVAGDDFILYATPWTSEFAGGNQHIAASNYQKYVDHLNEFSAYMKNQGVPLYAISISNEPDWCSEWACWSADEIYNFTKNYADQMRKNGTKVISTESFAYAKNMYDKVLNDASALKNWDILGAHFYAMVASTGDNFFQYSLADQKKVERWMTEHYTESQGSGNYWRTVMVTGDQATAAKKDTVRAMDVAYEIHRGLVVGNFSQYTWWYIRRCYGLIMEKDFGNKLSIPTNEIGKVSKRGYVLSQYARFVRPGAVRVGATANPEANLFASAYKSADGDSTIVVLVNRDYKNSKSVTINVPGSTIESFHVYTTSEAKNAKYEGEVEAKNGTVTITMESGATNKDCIVTLVGVGPQVVVPQEPFNDTKTPWAIPGKIQAEDFDIPGSGKDENGNSNASYYDTDSDNQGKSEYRKDTPVDVYDKKFGTVIGYNRAGEWLEYTVDVKKTGDYTMFAYVASSNGTASFQMLMDNKAITDTIVVPKTVTATEGDFDEFGKVQRNVSLTAGKHIMRFQVTGDWMDVDYFTFVEGKDATDPEPGEVTEQPNNPDPGLSIANVNFNVSGVRNYSVFDLNGNLMGEFQAMGTADIQKKTSALVKNAGSYLVKSEGMTARVNVK